MKFLCRSMSLFITSLNSGSNGNCYYVGNENEAVLIDAGISCREVEKRMARLNLPLEKVKALFISHEHSDHIRGVPVLASKYGLPVYITTHTLRSCPFRLEARLVQTFAPSETVHIGTLTIKAFPKLHDAGDPHSFMVSCQGTNVGIFTDIGLPCAQVIYHFKQCHAAFLEANYDADMLENGRYPIYLKNRIRGGKGHLSNQQALQLFTRHRPAYMTHLLLAHLSQQNNCPKLVQNLFTQQAAGTEIVVASRYAETPVYTIKPDNGTAPELKTSAPPGTPVQMALF